MESFCTVPVSANNLSVGTKGAIQRFYAKTKGFMVSNGEMAEKQRDWKVVEDAARDLLKKTADIDFGDIHYSTDSIVMIRRLMLLEFGKMPIKCAKLIVQNLVTLYFVIF